MANGCKAAKFAFAEQFAQMHGLDGRERRQEFSEAAWMRHANRESRPEPVVPVWLGLRGARPEPVVP